MNRQLMEVVLPRLARPLYQQLKRYRAGQMSDAQFTKGFESLLRRQHAWLASQGVPEARAALAIHGAVLILSGPGLRAEAHEAGVPLEIIECRAIREAAADLAKNYDVAERQAFKAISRLVARYGD
jgi:hypothetical protein